MITKTSELLTTKKNDVEITITGLLNQLYRHQKDINKLVLKLSSYTYEPRTPSLWSRSEKIKNDNQSLLENNRRIIAEISSGNEITKEISEQVNQQLEGFSGFQKTVDAYLQDCKKSCGY